MHNIKTPKCFFEQYKNSILEVNHLTALESNFPKTFRFALPYNVLKGVIACFKMPKHMSWDVEGAKAIDCFAIIKLMYRDNEICKINLENCRVNYVSSMPPPKGFECYFNKIYSMIHGLREETFNYWQRKYELDLFGWISTEGRFYACEPITGYEDLPKYIGYDEGELENEGWIKIVGIPPYGWMGGKKPTDNQKQWLINHNFEVNA